MLYAFIAFNLIVFLLYGADKHKAVKKHRRIRESTLIAPAFFMGAIGAMLGMIVFNHKTSKPKFRICIPLSFAENLALFYIIQKLL